MVGRNGVKNILLLYAICFISHFKSVSTVDSHVSNSELMHLLNLQTRIAERILKEDDEDETGDVQISLGTIRHQRQRVHQICKQFLDLLGSYSEQTNGSNKKEQKERERMIEESQSNSIRTRGWLGLFSNYISHPLNLFLMFSHWLESFPVWRDYLISSSNQTRRDEITEMLELFPTKSDLDHFALAVIRLQHMYDLDAAELASGRVQNISASRPLTKEECFFLADTAFQSALKSQFVDWYQSCEALFVSFHVEQRARRVDFEEKLEKIDSFLKSFSRTSTNLQRLPVKIEDKEDEEERSDDVNGKRGPEEREEDASWASVLRQKLPINIVHGFAHHHELPPSGDEVKPDWTNSDRTLKVFEAYKKLCQLREGLEFETSLVPSTSQEVCFFHHANGENRDTRQIRASAIDPYKAEIHSTDPLIVSFHDVISERVMRELILSGESRLEKPRSFSSLTGRVQETASRSGKVGFLTEGHSEIEQIAQAITSLDIAHTEPIQIVSYGVGGHYEPHVDYFGESLVPSDGDRLATLLFYLNDVQGGGSTVFPTLGLAIPPRKGSALLWYNLYKNGQGDPYTLHSGCPVLLGSKTIANIWFRSHGQEFRRPCALDPEA
ncbi:hypothetical protein TCAL_01376 [Tigriopus californicus]|uniref:procollagen-proline 4-dioxygenase n=1 Tax=Tigriopus californicus TaxID=6832 RepID=A0A553NUR9_TIGCA|nr:prolyl 4-hydroxylase subunit alpha-1-like [Tigriopus californicus]TRY69175.1 hypothetical protein TCAL_01376 [Tigriopus californicus]|eukprot:TCALIF_01376-PA protein Name:"Similar to P4HA2 Prolyl 4-hydroxylase subunit alpha-2 (Gallus gallus)" AED:0.43 eAED:0.43 QI:0/-1/0/1/-1/1/1/0/610